MIVRIITDATWEWVPIPIDEKQRPLREHYKVADSMRPRTSINPMLALRVVPRDKEVEVDLPDEGLAELAKDHQSLMGGTYNEALSHVVGTYVEYYVHTNKRAPKNHWKSIHVDGQPEIESSLRRRFAL